MYKEKQCSICGNVMIGQIVQHDTIYFCAKPGCIPKATKLFDGPSDYEDIADSLII
jgi:hypothetical protein